MGGRSRTAALLAVLVASSPLLRAQEPPGGATPAPDRERVLRVARQIMGGARFCTLVTLGELGQPQARIVDPLEPDSALVVYVATNPLSRKVSEIRKDPRVTLLYFDPARSAYVTLIGRAAEVPNPEKAAHRKKDWDAFFPAARPEAYILYRIVPSRVEVVSAKDGLSGDPATWRPEIVDLK
jgi:general stress protein 26